MAIDEAMAKIEQERARPLFLAQDYAMLKNANPTDKKGNSNQSLKRKYNKQAEKLFNIITTGKELKELKAIKLTPEQEQEALEQMKQALPKYNKQG